MSTGTLLGWVRSKQEQEKDFQSSPTPTESAHPSTPKLRNRSPHFAYCMSLGRTGSSILPLESPNRFHDSAPSRIEWLHEQICTLGRGILPSLPMCSVRHPVVLAIQVVRNRTPEHDRSPLFLDNDHWLKQRRNQLRLCFSSSHHHTHHTHQQH